MFLLLMPDALLIAAAVIPAAALLILVYRADRLEPEPPRLLGRLILMGVFATAIAKLAEYVGSELLDAVFYEETPLYHALLYFGVVGFSEEGAKYALLKRATWRSPEFNCRFDGVVYAVFVSLGFALWENIGYVTLYGLGTALIRALTAVPGHACFGVFMGCWYAQARELALLGREDASRIARTLAVALPALLHGGYDFLAVAAGGGSAWLFIAFVVAMFAYTLRAVRKAAWEDRSMEDRSR